MPHTSAESSIKSTSKHAAANRKASGKSAGPGKGNAVDRDEMIAVAAYYRAEHRGFDGGDPVADWLAAEAEIDAALNNPGETVVH
ncbi:MAG: DUF2934 domain-containing protein [Gallionellaceae bacterium]